MKKEKAEKIFCLFHKKADCPCIHPVTDFNSLKYRQESENRRLKLMEFFDKFKPFQNDTERICLGCNEPIKVGFVCRKSENDFVHNLDCWRKLEEKENQNKGDSNG